MQTIRSPARQHASSGDTEREELSIRTASQILKSRGQLAGAVTHVQPAQDSQVMEGNRLVPRGRNPNRSAVDDAPWASRPTAGRRTWKRGSGILGRDRSMASRAEGPHPRTTR